MCSTHCCIHLHSSIANTTPPPQPHCIYRKIFEDENLDEETKVAQKEEMERKQRLLEIQEKLKQQAIELRAQRERDLAAQKASAASKQAAGGKIAASKSAILSAAMNGDGALTTMSLKSLLESESQASPSMRLLHH